MGGSRGGEESGAGVRRASLLIATGMVGFGLAIAAVALAESVYAGRASDLVLAGDSVTRSMAALDAAPDVASAPPHLPAAMVTPAATPAPEPPALHIAPNGVLSARGVIRVGGSLGRALGSQGVPASAIHTITREMRGIFDFRSARAGDQWSIVHDVESGVLDFQYATADLSTYHLKLDPSGEYVALRHEPVLERRTARIAGVVSTSLYDAIRDLGESPQLASDFAELFAWDVDFQRSVQAGDRFSILYERLYRTPPGGTAQYMGPGLTLAARYEGQTGEHELLYFEKEEARGGYYRSDGSSLERQFLVSPVKYSRIASRYNPSRRHPILKVTRPHYGIDYAASRGTPIFAVADGQVIYRGWSSGYGKLVKVRHNNGFISYYAHMSRYADTVQLADYVHQKQVIGYVGSTGLATGPHVCFRIKNQQGRFVNPATLRTPAGDPIPSERMPEFELARDVLFSQLDGGKVIATDEAL